jgi:hypothetical protein
MLIKSQKKIEIPSHPSQNGKKTNKNKCWYGWGRRKELLFIDNGNIN